MVGCLPCDSLNALRGGHTRTAKPAPGITPEIDPEHVRVLVEAVRELSPAYHR